MLSGYLRGAEQQDITCTVRYYQSQIVTFTWQAVRRNGGVITLPGHMHPTINRDGSAEYISVLNYTLLTEDFQGVLRCTARVDGEINNGYEAKDEQLNFFYGMY